MARRLIALEVILEVDSDKAEALKGYEGWSSPDGDGEPPISGIALRADQLVVALSHRALEEWREPLDAVIAEVNFVIEDIVDEEAL
jgi:hypothetical protein